MVTSGSFAKTTNMVEKYYGGKYSAMEIDTTLTKVTNHCDSIACL